jgi:sortase A
MEQSTQYISQKKERNIPVMKRTTAIIIIIVLCLSLSIPAYANNYDFSSGDETLPGFGKSTSNDNPVPTDPMSDNTRRNKDAAYLPPPYFYGSGNIPTDQSSLYHDNLPGGVSAGSSGGIPGSYNPASGNAPVLPSAPGLESSTSIIAINTAPLYYADGSIGSIYVARTGKTIKVYEGEQLENLKIGAGHFTSTSAWDGNVAMCGHNRGSWPFFSFVKDLQMGDRITYTTQYGVRTFEVYSKEQISEYDYSKLGWTADNVLTLITCIENARELRWAAQCREVQ